MAEDNKAKEEVKEEAPVQEKEEKPKKEKKTSKKTAKKEEAPAEEEVTKPKKEKKAEAPPEEAEKIEEPTEKVEKKPKKEKKTSKKEKKAEAPPEEAEKIEEPAEKVEKKPKKEKKSSKKGKKEEAPTEEVVKAEVESAKVEEEPKEEPPAEKKKSAKKTTKKEEEDEGSADIEKPVEEEVEEAPKKEKKRDPFPEELVFGKFNSSDVVVEDPSLRAFINLDPALVPHSSARHANKPFYKSKISIVERLINNMMRTEKYTGKKTKSYKAVLEAFEIIQERTKENPIQILVRAIENSAPREEVTRLKFGGISVPKSVDTAPSRRLDIALRNITVGTVKSSQKNRKSVAECLASELIAGANKDLQSFGVSKRDEIERVAKSAH